MSRYTYVGDFQNPADSYFVKFINDKYQVWVKEQNRCDCGCPNCKAVVESERPSNPLKEFADHEEADQYIESVQELFEEDYEQYCEENHYEIAQQERYDMWRNEY